MSAAIVTTLRNAGTVLESFIRYHLEVGFEHLFLFFDDPEDDSIGVAETHEGVTVIRHDDDLRERWRRTPVYGEEHIGGCIESEVMARQMLNAQVAVSLARERGIEWLLHIDADELFYSFTQTADEHFGAMTAQDVGCVTYLNHEGVPERADIGDFFREVTLFKRNPKTRNDPSFKPHHAKLLRSVPQVPLKFFHFYANGKSAARVTDDLEVDSVHDFRVTEDRRIRPHKNPVILHYPCCGFRHFWDKYATLGRFSDRWFGTLDIRKAIGNFHSDSRDVVMSGDEEAAKRFYLDRVVTADTGVVRNLLDSGLFMRIDEPSTRLASGQTSDAGLA